jgi:hypothetical protein
MVMFGQNPSQVRSAVLGQLSYMLTLIFHYREPSCAPPSFSQVRRDMARGSGGPAKQQLTIYPPTQRSYLSDWRIV